MSRIAMCSCWAETSTLLLPRSLAWLAEVCCRIPVEPQTVNSNSYWKNIGSACLTRGGNARPFGTTTATQIDFIAVRKPHADALAKQAHPIALDLSPWRAGPKHAPVKASVPLIAGWRLQRKLQAHTSFCRRPLPVAC